MVGLQGAFELQRFAPVEVPTIDLGNPVPLYNASEREDPVLTGEAYVAWNVMDWARLTATYRVRANLTDFVVTTGAPSGPGRPNNSAAEYIKHEVFLLTEFEY